MHKRVVKGKIPQWNKKNANFLVQVILESWQIQRVFSSSFENIIQCSFLFIFIPFSYFSLCFLLVFFPSNFINCMLKI